MFPVRYLIVTAGPLRFHTAGLGSKWNRVMNTHVPKCREVGRAGDAAYASGRLTTGRVAHRPTCIPHLTVVVRDTELGTGNQLYIRGEGGGLSWDIGQPLVRVDTKTWLWSTSGRSNELEFQILLNDEVWAQGAHHVLRAGTTLQVRPDFEWPDIPRVSKPRPAPLTQAIRLPVSLLPAGRARW